MRPVESISLSHRRLLFAAICIREALFKRARELFINKDLTQGHFPIETFVLESLNTHFEEFGELPDLEMVRSRMTADIIESGELVDSADEREVDEIYSMACSLQQRQPDGLDRVANSLMDTFLEYCMRQQVMHSLDRSLPVLSILEAAQHQLRTGLATAADRFASVFDKLKANTTGGRFIPFGIPFLDYFIAGTGPASGDVVGHAAVRGGGKTTLSSQVAVAVAKREEEVHRETGEPLKIVYIFNYEEVKDPMTQMLVYVARVPRDTVDQYMVEMHDEMFSKGRDYKAYELTRYRGMIARAEEGKGPWPLAEWERIQAAEKFISSHIQLADFTGDDQDNSELSGKYVQGIKEYIQMHQDQIGNPGVAAVIIDYAGSCVRVHVSKTPGLSDRNFRTLIDDLPLLAKREIANPMKCFVWVAQQLAAVEAGRKKGTRPDPNAFKDCKSFAENCVFTIVSGVPTDEGLAVFVQSKARRGGSRNDQVVRLNGEYSHWIEASKEYTVVRGQVMSRADAEYLNPANIPGAIPDTMQG